MVATESESAEVVTLGSPFRDRKYSIKPAFHDADTDIIADILARIVARMSACRATSPFSLPHE